MSPLDDELRRTLTERASVLTPSADPLAGIEARAGRIRRRRTLTAMTGAALAVAVVAIAVPVLSDGRPGATPERFATPSSDTVRSSYALDPEHPWDFRGTLTQGARDAFQRDFASQQKGGSLQFLFGQTYEPSAQEEAAFVYTGSSGPHYGFVTGSESGPDSVYDLPLPAEETVLSFPLPGDEVARLLVIAAPSVTSFEYAGDGLAFTPMTRIADGVAIVALEGERSLDRLRVTAPDGTVLYDGEAHDPQVVESPAPSTGQPANLLPWPERGDEEVGPSIPDLTAAFGRARGRSDGAGVAYRALFTGDTDSAVRFTVGQAWLPGDSRATTVTYATGTTKGAVLTQHGFTPESPQVLAGLVKDLPGTTIDLLVVVPIPTTGQVSYSSEPTGSFRPVTGQDYLEGAVLIDRAKGETDDRIEVLDGNGDLDKPLYRGPVATVLAGVPVH